MARVLPPAAGAGDVGAYMVTKYAPALMVWFWATTVFGAIANTDHQKEIQNFGDTVEIDLLPEVQSFRYTPYMQMPKLRPSPTKVNLLIDNAFAYQVPIDIVENKQSQHDLPASWGPHCASQLQQDIDKEVLNNIYADVASTNTGATAGKINKIYNLGVAGTPVEVTPSNVTKVLTTCKAVLSENNVPAMDGLSWIVFPEAFWLALVNSEMKDASLRGDGKSLLLNGRLGQLGGLNLHVSNNLTPVWDAAAGKWCFHVVFGHKAGLTFASQLVENETIKSQDFIGWYLRGVHVFGYKVVKPDVVGHLYCTIPALS